jgi:hypothetical protein
MSKEKEAVIEYDGKQINMFYDDRDDYVSLTDISKAWKGTRSIATWLKNKQTIEFLAVWEKRYNADFNIHGFEYFLKAVKDKNFSLSVQTWIDRTNSKGIFSKPGARGGTYAHKDIAVRFTGWLSPEFELYLIDEIKRLKTLEEQKNNFQLLSHEEILSLVRLKEIFKYVAHQALVEDAHRDVFSAQSDAKNTIAQFHKFRNDILDIAPSTIDDRIKEYCLKNSIPLTKKIANKTKREKILMIDSYDAVKYAVWDFLSINNEVNALSLADLVSNMMRIERGEIIRTNETTLFRQKEDLGEFTEFEEYLSKNHMVNTAREVLEYRKYSKGLLSPKETQRLIGTENYKKLLGFENSHKPKELSDFNNKLTTAINYNPKNKE